MPTPYLTGTVKFNKLTQGIYDALGDNVSPYQFYITTDTNNAYLGKIRLFDVFHLVDSFDEPYSGDIKPKSLCVRLTQGEDGTPLIEAKILQEDYTFKELVPPVMGEIVDEDLTEDRTVPTRRAVWKFVDDRLTALQEYFDALENRVVGYMERAETAAVNAEESEQAAADSADDANDSAIESESYAHGGTGTRPGEDTDNAKYYMDQAKEAAEEGGGSSEEARRQAEKAAQSAAEALQSEQNAKASENAAALSEQNAHGSKVDAAASAVSAAGSAADASASADNAHSSEVNASASETAASGSASEAAGSARDAAASADEAAQSERNAAGSETAAANSAAAAQASEGKAKTSELNAAQSEANALSYRNDASASAGAAANSAADALDSEGKAKASEQNAAASETAAAASAVNAEQSAISAYNSKNDASASATAAHNSEVAAAASESQVAHDASEAASSAAAAEQSEQNAADNAKLSESWAKGDTGVRQGEDTNNAKYWAEEARKASPDGKADKVIGATAGDLAGLDSTGNLTDSGIPADNVALQNGSYDTLYAGRAGNLVDDRAPSTGRKFGFDTACGDISISDDGTADPTLLKGTTYVKNQLVGDSKVVKDVGQGVVTSPVAVAGDIDHAYIKGRSLIKNQLVPASVEKEGSSSTGVVEVSDAVAGNALALRMVAPRSVVMNQLVDSLDGTKWGGTSTLETGISSSVSDGVFTLTTASGSYHRLGFAGPYLVSGHTYALYVEVRNFTVSNARFGIKEASPSLNTTVLGTTTPEQSSNTWKPCSVVGLATVSNPAYNLIPFLFFANAETDGSYAEFRNMMCVDLTQYFNGDQTLIDSITSWDDLVAYDPRFASYVEYNTGEVAGVQPDVKVSGKNLQSKATSTVVSAGVTFTPNSDGSITVSGTADGAATFVMPYVRIKQGNIYTASGISSATNIIWDSVKLVDAEHNTLWTSGGSSSAKITVDTSAYPTATEIQLRFKRSNNGAVSGTIYPQLELGFTATSYEPYHDGGTAQAPAPLFAVGNAADEFEAVSGVTTQNIGSYTFTGNETIALANWSPKTGTYAVAFPANMLQNQKQGLGICAFLPSVSYVTLWGQAVSGIYFSGDSTIQYSLFVRVPTSIATDNASLLTWLSGKTIYYALATPSTSQSTPTQISLQAGNNVAMQTDGGRTASSMVLDYDGTSFDVPLKTGRSYLVKQGSTSTLVTDGSTQSVTGGQDMIVDLNTLYNNVSSLITPIADWNALVSDTGMYGSYTAYDEGTVVHSDQTEVKVKGKNLFDKNALASYLFIASTTTVDGRTCIAVYGPAAAASANGHTVIFTLDRPDYCTLSFDAKKSGANGLVRATFRYTDGTSEAINRTITDSWNSYSIISAKKVLSFSLNNGDNGTGYAAYYDLNTIQVELGSTATSYVPYFNGGTATAGLLKGVPGSVYDQLDAVTGNVTTRIGSYTFTGNETWTAVGTAGRYYVNNIITNAYRVSSSSTVNPYMMVGYRPLVSISDSSPDYSFELNSTRTTTQNQFMLKDSTVVDATALAAKMAGKTVYYRLATYTKSTTTPQPLTQPTGGLTVLQTAGTLSVGLDIRHAVSEWDEPIVRNCKYIFRDNDVDSLVTGSTTVTYKHVVGGVNKLINLTQWFGRNREPSIADFYKLFPTWKDADIPGDRGTILNYKGTGVRTIGFNAYNHATGTAVLLGGHQYQICGTYTSVSYVDQWGNSEEITPDADGLFTPLNNGTLTVVGGNDTDTCVHLTWSGYKNYGQPDYEWFPYEEKGVSWDLSQWFPNGMNGIGDNQDLMQNNSMTQKWGRKVFDGTEIWNDYATHGGFYTHIGGMKTAPGTGNEGACNFVQVWTASISSITGSCVLLGSADTSAYFCYVRDESSIETVDDWKAYLAELYAAGTPLILIYPLATPVTSDVTPTQNFSYPVNDFGTEQSLPVNTLTLFTTDLDADIRYSLDFTRTVANYSKIEDKVKDLVEEKDNLARQDGNYGDKGGVFNYATQLLDPNAPPTEASYGNRTAAGDVSIADNGTADVTSLQGTTQIQNQLVHDTNMNAKSSVDGKLVLTDAVGGQLSRLEVHGGCVVHNQLVKESVEKTVSGTGRLGVEDGVAGNAKSLVMTAPRSVVMNQQGKKPSEGGAYTRKQAVSTVISYDGDTVISTLTATSLSGNFPDIGYNCTLQAGHKYAVYSEQQAPYAGYMRLALEMTGSRVLRWEMPSADEFVTCSGVFTIGSTTRTYVNFFMESGAGAGTYVQKLKNLMLVDLTQYFNGNTTLINSINTWDDLVAYDSTFASYVPYDTGTVKGVQPTVKVNHTTDVACPVELFGVDDTIGDTFDGVSGVVTRKMTSVDLGTLTWNRSNNSGNWANYVFLATLPADWKKKDNALLVTPRFTRNVYILTTEGTADGYDTRSSGYIYIKADTYTDADSFKVAMSGVYLYYELATPTTSQYNPTTIPVVDIYNTALQTAGTRPCGLSLTYDGKDQTIALNPAHTYVFNDNQEDDSLITGQSSIEAVGGEDQLVDVTQLYNGDATKIANIHSWASLSTRFHRYRDFLPYNAGTVEPDCPVIRKFDNEHAYGIIYDPSQNTPACQRVELNNGVLTEVASFSDFSETPCHQLYRCVMSDLANRTIAYYLDDEDSDKKYNGTRNGVTSDGTASVLTGADGDVETEMPIGYWDLDEDWQGTGKRLWLISDRPFMGSYYPAEIHDFFYVSPDGSTPRKQYVGSYRGCICDADGNPLNTTEGALAQVTGTASTNKVRSIKGALPYVSVSLNDFTVKSGRNGGSSVNVKFHQWLFLLMAIEYGTLDNQAISYGYAGGIQNAFCFWRKSGRVNAGNGTAEIKAVEGTQDMDNFQKFTIDSTTVQRDTLMDADGRYAWSVYNRNASSTRYFTASPTPSNGDPVYTASTGTTTAGTVASYAMQSNRTIQFQYRGIENPFGEVWEFEHGIQKFQTGSLKSFRGTDNLTYARDPLGDGPSSYAWRNTGDTVLWTNTAAPGTSTTMYSDSSLTTSVTTKYKDQPVYRYSSEGYWETLATSDYTMTSQRTAANPVYTVRHNHWPLSGWDSKFDPVTFFMRKTGSPGASGRYLPDYWYNDGTVGDRVVYVGGNCYYGSYVGLGYRYVYGGLATAYVAVSGRPSA